MTLFEELNWRGFINQTTLADPKQLDDTKWTFYHGYDASADSLTVGNLAALMMDKVFVRHGHKAIILAGGATSMIGDPGGKDTERPLQPEDKIEDNVAAVRKQIEKLFGGEVTMVNNLEWFGRMNVLEFLRDVGKHFSMTPLVQRDYIARRIGEGGAGISYTEFSYTLLQGYDYLHLHDTHKVNLQLAGSDQWGNSISGVDLVRRVTGDEVHILTCPLIINEATGKKFGKSEEGAVWLDPARTSIYKFYQFWLNADDKGVETYLKIFTELDKKQITEIIARFNENRAGRIAQKRLAFEVTRLIHGMDAAESQQRIADVIFGSRDPLELKKADYDVLVNEFPVARIPRRSKTEEEFINALVDTGLATSKTEARRFMANGAIYINNQQIKGTSAFYYFDDHAVVRRGKNTIAIFQIVSK